MMSIDSYRSESLAELATALALAQADFTSIPRDKKVSVKMKNGGTYKFTYADMDSTNKMIREPLAKNGLCIIFRIRESQLVTMLLHKSGEFIESEMPLPQHGTNYQEYGSALTYLKRYALTAILGLSTEEDDDANVVDGNTVNIEPEKPWYNSFKADQARMLASIKTGKTPQDILDQITEKYKVSKTTRNDILNIEVGGDNV